MRGIDVIYQDDQLMVLNKPPGLVVDKSETQRQETVEDILKRDFAVKLQRGGIVHRLDKDTSGVLLVAKTQSALENLQAQFQNREVKKEYLALVHGVMEKDREVRGAISRNTFNRQKFTVSSDGRESKTVFHPNNKLEMSEQTMQNIFSGFSKIQLKKLSTIHYSLFTLLTCLPQTGRTHQIRVHLKYIGFPIVADVSYGGRKIVRLDKRWCPRQFLHASRLEFTHPVSGEKMSFESELPEDLKKALKLLAPNLSS